MKERSAVWDARGGQGLMKQEHGEEEGISKEKLQDCLLDAL